MVCKRDVRARDRDETETSPQFPETETRSRHYENRSRDRRDVETETSFLDSICFWCWNYFIYPTYLTDVVEEWLVAPTMNIVTERTADASCYEVIINLCVMWRTSVKSSNRLSRELHIKYGCAADSFLAIQWSKDKWSIAMLVRKLRQLCQNEAI